MRKFYWINKILTKGTYLGGYNTTLQEGFKKEATEIRVEKILWWDKSLVFFLGSELMFMTSDQKELHSKKLPACSNVKTQLWFLTTLVFIQWSCTLVQIWNYTTSDHIGLHSMGLHGWSISLKSHKLFQTTLKYT